MAAATHRFWIKKGHSAFGTVLSDDEDDGGGEGGSIVVPNGLLDGFANPGLPHPYLNNKAYFSGVDNRKMSAKPTENSAAQGQIPEPNLKPSLSHSHQAQSAPRASMTPRPG